MNEEEAQYDEECAYDEGHKEALDELQKWVNEEKKIIMNLLGIGQSDLIAGRQIQLIKLEQVLDKLRVCTGSTK